MSRLDKKPIESLLPHEIEAFLSNINQPKFRVQQILEWLYKHDVSDFSEMTNLPRTLIDSLTENFDIIQVKAAKRIVSSDKTVKYVLSFSNHKDSSTSPVYIETVGIPSKKEGSKQLTICVSTQAGCSMGCKFCATGQQGCLRSLYMGEILKQVLFVSKDMNTNILNIVLMGQGEPFLNFENVSQALEILNDPKFFNVGARKITISTCGILSGIQKLSNINKQYGLAVSLHSARQKIRNKIMPGVSNYSLDNLKKEICNYISKTNRRVTFEYLMLNNINDTKKDLESLIEYCIGLLCHVNLIKFNDVPNSNFAASSKSTINTWIEKLNASGIETTLRDSRGADIDAACGQLLNSLNN